MFRETTHIIFTALLLIFTIGITISKHYSKGELFSVALFGDAESCCENPCDCCSDETETYQLDVDYLQVYFDYNEIRKIDLFANFRLDLILNISEKTTTNFQFDNKLSSQFPDILILQQEFRC